MTKEQKINWLQEATVEQILNQFKVAAVAMARARDDGDVEKIFKYAEDMEFCKAELIARLSK